MQKKNISRIFYLTMLIFSHALDIIRWRYGNAEGGWEKQTKIFPKKVDSKLVMVYI